MGVLRELREEDEAPKLPKLQISGQLQHVFDGVWMFFVLNVPGSESRKGQPIQK